MAQESISVEVQFRSGVEQLTLTPLGDRLYRLALSTLALLDKGFSLGGVIHGTRDEWHER